MTEQPSVVYGTVYDPAGNPVAGARVYFTDSPFAMPDIAALTDGEGKFSLSVPADGTYGLECNAEGFSTKSTAVSVAGEQKIDIDIKLKN